MKTWVTSIFYPDNHSIYSAFMCSPTFPKDTHCLFGKDIAFGMFNKCTRFRTKNSRAENIYTSRVAKKATREKSLTRPGDRSFECA